MYDAWYLTQFVRRCLENAPLTSLTQMARAANVDRHTLTRALRTAEGLTFRQLRSDTLRRRIAVARTTAPPRSVKEIAFELGYRVPSSLARQCRAYQRRGR